MYSSPHDALRALEWSIAVGADEALADDGYDRFAANAARSAASAEIAGAQPGLSAPPTVTLAQQVVEDAKTMAAAANTLDELRAAMESFEGCSLKTTAMRLVFADGAPGAKLMLIGEAPGRDEDMQGRPFVGKSGQLLDRMLAAIGLDRTSVYIANLIPWRPPGNRTPTPQEVQICLPFIQRHIELAQPQMLMFLGAASAQAMTGASEGIMRLRGRWLDYSLNGRTLRALPSLHPAYLLRNPRDKRLSWMDMLAVKQELGL
jgi:DNA polymerase